MTPIDLDYNATTPVAPDFARPMANLADEGWGVAVLPVEGTERARGAARLSLGEPTTDDEITTAAEALIAAWRSLTTGR